MMLQIYLTLVFGNLAFPVQKGLHPSSEFFLTVSLYQMERETNKDLDLQMT